MQDLLNQLNQKLVFTNTTSSHYIYKCPIPNCESHQTEGHGHLHISKSKPVFRCVKCGYSGHITKLLNDLNIQNFDISKINFNKNLSRSYNHNNIILSYDYEDIILEYMNNRLNIEPEDLKYLNIISIADANKLLKPLNKQIYNCIPFLTNKNEQIICRLLNNDKYRYLKFNLTDNSKDYYCIKNPKTFTNMYMNKTIIITEGIFDIISIWKHKWIKNIDDNCIYICSGNGLYNGAIEYASRLMLNHNPNIIACIDDDNVGNKYRNWLNKINYNNIEIYQNLNNKDFGCLDVQPKIIYSNSSNKKRKR